jgi:vacuolar-type H+-ATPase subunit C/Vma6
LLAPLFEDEDCRSVRALLRGAAASVPAERRTAGLIPTLQLSERALSELALLGDVTDIAATLAAWGNAYGSALLEVAGQKPDLFRLEVTISRTYVQRARRVAPRCGRAMRVFVARRIDLDNAWTALLIADHGSDVSPASLFVDGGEVLDRETFLLASTSRSRSEAAALLSAAARAAPLAAAMGTDAGVEDRVLRALIREQRDIARLDPLGPAPIIEFALKARAELSTLRRIIWGKSLGAPVTVQHA